MKSFLSTKSMKIVFSYSFIYAERTMRCQFVNRKQIFMTNLTEQWQKGLQSLRCKNLIKHQKNLSRNLLFLNLLSFYLQYDDKTKSSGSKTCVGCRGGLFHLLVTSPTTYGQGHLRYWSSGIISSGRANILLLYVQNMLCTILLASWALALFQWFVSEAHCNLL